MRKFILTCFLVFITTCCLWAQQKNTKEYSDTSVVYKEQDNGWAEFPGGQDAQYKFLKHNLQYPDDAQKQKIEGKVMVGFTVKKSGSISNIHILKSVYPSLDKEALRVIALMPDWVAKKKNGTISKARYKIDIIYKLHED